MNLSPKYDVFELKRGHLHIDIQRRPDGTYGGGNIYGSGKELWFRNIRHMKTFAEKFNYELASFDHGRNT